MTSLAKNALLAQLEDPKPGTTKNNTRTNADGTQSYIDPSGSDGIYKNPSPDEEPEPDEDSITREEVEGFLEDMRTDVLKQWIKYRTLEQQCQKNKDQPNIRDLKDKFMDNKIKYELLKTELEQYCEANDMKDIPCNGTYLYYRGVFKKFIRVIKPGYADTNIPDQILQKAMKQGKLKAVIEFYKKQYDAIKAQKAGTPLLSNNADSSKSGGGGGGDDDDNDDEEEGDEEEGDEEEGEDGDTDDGDGDTENDEEEGQPKQDGDKRRVRKNHSSRDAADAERYERIDHMPTSYEEALQQALGHLSVRANEDRISSGQISVEEEREANEAASAFSKQLIASSGQHKGRSSRGGRSGRKGGNHKHGGVGGKSLTNQTAVPSSSSSESTTQFAFSMNGSTGSNATTTTTTTTTTDGTSKDSTSFGFSFGQTTTKPVPMNDNKKEGEGAKEQTAFSFGESSFGTTEFKPSTSAGSDAPVFSFS